MNDQQEHPAQVHLTESAMGALEARMAEAVRQGIRESITEELAEQFWSAGLTVLQRQAQAHAGRFVLGSMANLFKKAAMFIVLGGLVYSLGGWSALVGLFKAVFSPGAPT